MPFLYIVCIVIAFIIHGLFWGVITNIVADKRRLNDSYFIWGFFLGWIGILLVLIKEPDNRPAPRTVRYLTKDEGEYKTVRAIGEWKCVCGRINNNYVGTCACGRTKAEVLGLLIKKPVTETEITPIQSTDPIQNLNPEENINLTDGNKETSVSQEIENLQQIKLLKELLDMGAVTQEEYDLKKKQLLGL